MVGLETGSHFVTMVTSSLSLLSAGITGMCHHTWLPAMTSILSPLVSALHPHLGICIMFGLPLPQSPGSELIQPRWNIGFTNRSSSVCPGLFCGSICSAPHLSPLGCCTFVSPIPLPCPHACPLFSLCSFEHSLLVFLFLPCLGSVSF